MATKRFSLIIDQDTYEEFYRCFPVHGSRQAILRRIVRLLIFKSIQRSGHKPRPPTWLSQEMENKPLDDIITKILEDFKEKQE